MNLRWLPVFTRRDLDRAIQVGEELGTARAYMKGYRQGCVDSLKIRELRAQSQETRDAERWLAEVNAAREPVASRRALRLVDTDGER
jgi:hypothetical protein